MNAFTEMHRFIYKHHVQTSAAPFVCRYFFLQTNNLHFQVSSPDYNLQDDPFKLCPSLPVKFPNLVGYRCRILDLIGFTFLQLKT